jgi:hypothetical protein
MHIKSMEHLYQSKDPLRLIVTLVDGNEIVTMKIYEIDDIIRFKKFHESGIFHIDKNSDFYKEMIKYIIKTEKILPQIFNYDQLIPCSGSISLYPEQIEKIQNEIIKNLGIPEKILKPKEKLTRKVIL